MLLVEALVHSIVRFSLNVLNVASPLNSTASWHLLAFKNCPKSYNGQDLRAFGRGAEFMPQGPEKRSEGEKWKDHRATENNVAV